MTACVQEVAGTTTAYRLRSCLEDDVIINVEGQSSGYLGGCLELPGLEVDTTWVRMITLASLLSSY